MMMMMMTSAITLAATTTQSGKNGQRRRGQRPYWPICPTTTGDGRVRLEASRRHIHKQTPGIEFAAFTALALCPAESVQHRSDVCPFVPLSVCPAGDSPGNSTDAASVRCGLSVRSADALVVFTARCYASAVLAMGLCLSVCPSQVGVLSKRLNESSWVLARELSFTRPTLC